VTFISYAQNYEDVMLWRALKHVEKGFYIDVGAAHPDDYSVTRAFYDRGWHGINVEPTSQYFQRLAGARPRDLNLNIALAAQAGHLPFFEVEGTGLSTLDRGISEEHRAAGWTVHEATIQVNTLAEICRDHVAGDVHFLKIDVEGAEAAVLAGADLGLCRPWIILVEATRPLSSEQNHLEWEAIVTKSDYRFAYFDGLNRFY
jgi:FkbM family methyltransferase